MAIKIDLMTNRSELNKVGKDITTLFSTTGFMKDETSLTDPVFRITVTHATASRTNYIWVPGFLRYYFVKDCISLRNNMYEFVCHVDVLESWKTQIKANAAIVRRQQEQWNMYINDGQFKTMQNPNIYTMAFPSGFDSQTPCVALAVCGGSGGGNGGGGGGF